jgi:hypothetical protein
MRTGRPIAPLSVTVEERAPGRVGSPAQNRASAGAALAHRAGMRGWSAQHRELEDAIRHYLDLNNRHPKPLIWTKTAEQILESVAVFCKRISNSGH